MNIETDDGAVIMPGLEDQAKFVAKQRAQEIVQYIDDRINENSIDIALSVDENNYSKTHLLEKDKGFEPPHHELVTAYFEQLKAYDKQYTNQGLATFLGLADGRSVRRYTSGEKKIPYDVWRKFLVATGRAPIDRPVMIGFFK